MPTFSGTPLVRIALCLLAADILPLAEKDEQVACKRGAALRATLVTLDQGTTSALAGSNMSLVGDSD
jgi:hypothetical protein